jgi:amino acid adenylation domain-containing protein
MTSAQEANASSLSAIFAESVRRTPDAPALRHAGHSVTYAELDNAVAALATTLPAGEIIGLAHPRGLEQITALLAIHRAGSTPLPLDPAYPAESRAFMQQDAGARLVLGETGSRPPATSNQTQPPLAYLLYTSGSTGRPKGVAMPHHAILNLLAWQRRVLPLRAGARVLQFAPLSFDVSFQEIFSTLAEGGCLVLTDDDTRRDPRRLAALVEAEQIERLFLPYVALQSLAERAPHAALCSLRDVVTAGEQLRITPQIRALFAARPECRLHNHYGPTETHVCTAHTLAGPAEDWSLLPPIGRPIDGTHVLLLDEAGQPADTGDLHVGGACLADGYFGRSELTAERFVTLEGTRHYRTGDLVRRGADGTLEYLGRADDQIKVRGFRIEPGEIEAQLAQHPAVRECAVTARDNRLLAYWTGTTADPSALRAFLAEKLPPQFIPSIFTRIDAMPLTPSGKIARRQLPEPARPADPRAAAGPPPTTLAQLIAGVWEQVLGTPVAPAMNFFDAGGTSLLAVTAQGLLEEKLQRELPVTLLFQYPTIQALAAHLEGDRPPQALAAQAQARAAAQRAALARRSPRA